MTPAQHPQRVKNCPCRVKCREHAHHASVDIFFSCIWPEGNMDRSHYECNMECRLHGNATLFKCECYNRWAKKQIDDSFKELERSEKHLAAFREVMKI